MIPSTEEETVEGRRNPGDDARTLQTSDTGTQGTSGPASHWGQAEDKLGLQMGCCSNTKHL